MNAQIKQSHAKSPRKLLAAILILVCLMLISSSRPLRAEAHVHTFVVNSTDDEDDAFYGDGDCNTMAPDGECTLRAALSEAWALWDGTTFPPADLDTHTIQVPAGTYFVYTGTGYLGELGVTGNVVIDGAGRDTTIIMAQGGSVMSVGLGSTALINDLTITNGLAASAAGIFNAGDLTLTNVAVTNNYANVASGGGIRNFGALVLDHVLMSGNTAELNAGAIENVSSATLTITDSTFYRNKSLDTTGTASGGAIWNNTGCTVTVQRSTFDGNSAPFGGGIFNTGDALFTNVTLTNNKGTSTLAAGGAAIYNNTPGQLWLWNVTIAANESTYPAALTNSSNIVVMAHTIVSDNIGGDCNNTGSITIGEHHNLAGDSSCTFMTDLSDQTSTDPKLLALADNGGPTQTMALASDSPAIDAGGTCMSGGAPLLIDQRGWPRTVDGDVDGTATCDLGAFEAPPPYQLWLPLIMR